jgi:hypothetical protein
MKNNFFLSIAIILFFFSCDDNRFPPKVKLDTLSKTTFTPTLESPLQPNKNAIYAATLAMAWQEIKEELPHIKHIDNPTLENLHTTKRHQNILESYEYEATAQVDDFAVTARAFFSKSLPFPENVFERHDNPILFADQQKVTAFGFYDYNASAKILFYNSDEDFAIKLLPKDTSHEIYLLHTSLESIQNLQQAIEILNKQTQLFQINKNEQNLWRYSFREGDHVSIPCISYHIEHNYPDLQGATFNSQETIYTIAEAYQRTAFSLDEDGAEIESEATLKVSTTELIEEKIEPKHLIFNRSYLILLKRTDKKDPYFAMLVNNSELLQKQ